MPPRKSAAKRNARRKAHRSPGGGRFERLRNLSQELLRYATQGLLRTDFLPEVSKQIRRFSGSDVVELWVKEGPRKHFRCAVGGSKRTSLGCILVPRPLGGESSPPPGENREPDVERLCCQVIRGSVDPSHPCFTESGSFWSCKALDARDPGGAIGRTLDLRTKLLVEPYRSRAVIPIRLEEDCIGLLQMKSRKRDFFSIDDIVYYEDLSETLGIALSYHSAEFQLRERVKEMTCLYGLARVMARHEAPFEEIVQGVVDLLPPAWLYPEIASARIVLDGRSYTTASFRETPHRQVSDVVVNANRVGSVEVAYLEERPALDEGPFLEEERSLIDGVAREVAGFYERARALEDRTLLQDQLRHADRLATIGQLAAGVAHELNEPLGNILGFAQLAKKTEGLTPQVEKDLGSIETGALHAREIIKKLMAFARQLPAKKLPVNLNDIVSEGLYFFEARCAKAGIQLVRRLAANLPEITVDPGQINQVLVNLVVNSIQAMPDGGVLSVETFLVDDGVCLAVEDTGEGMSDEVKRQIFLPFFTTKDISEGTGLGLAVVHGIVMSHRGTITVESERGRGSRFVIHLPLRPPQRANERRE